MKHRLFILLTVVLSPLVAGSPVLAIDPGVAKGTLVIGDQTISLSHSVAFRFQDEEKLAKGPELRVLVTDREIAPALLADHALDRLDQLARDGGVRGLLLRVDPKGASTDVSGMVLFPPASPQASLAFFTAGGSELSIRNLKVSENRVTGESSGDYGKDSAFPDMPKYTYDVSFSAPIFRDEPVTARLTATAARKSPQVQVLVGYVTAVRAGDLTAASKFSTPAKIRGLQAMRARMGETAFREAAVELLPDGPALVRQVQDVVVRGNRALVIITEEGNRNGHRLVQVDGAWKVD
jgi:hypothetical protein